ncbi:MAG: type II toxin-antitoxin system RelE/ParE family toxin [Bacteroidota bacterium]
MLKRARACLSRQPRRSSANRVRSARGTVEAYYEEVAPDFAALFVAGAFETAARLTDFPRAGRIVPEIGDASIRELIYRQYRIIYTVIEGTAEILTVYHSARQFGTLG